MQAVYKIISHSILQKASYNFAGKLFQCKCGAHDESTRRKPLITYPVDGAYKMPDSTKRKFLGNVNHNAPDSLPVNHSHKTFLNRPKHRKWKDKDNLYEAHDYQYKKVNKTEDILYGIHPVYLALKADRREIHHIYFKKGEKVNDKINEIIEMAKEKNIEISGISLAQLRHIVKGDKVHQGICCRASYLPFEELTERNLTASSISNDINNEDSNLNNTEKTLLWIYLDQIQDPMNFGAILRTAYYLGVDKVLTSKENSCSISGIVSKASSGVAELVPVYHVPDTLKLVEFLCGSKWDVVSTSLPTSDMSIPVENYIAKQNTLLVVGNEGKGVSPDILSACTATVSLPARRELHQGVDSLNVSVATAIILHVLRKKLDDL